MRVGQEPGRSDRRRLLLALIRSDDQRRPDLARTGRPTRRSLALTHSRNGFLDRPVREKGMEEKSAEFKDKGGEVYLAGSEA